MKPRKKPGTDFKRLDTMNDADIDLSDIPEITLVMFAKGIVRRGLTPITKKQLTLRLDSDVIEWYLRAGKRMPNKDERFVTRLHGRTQKDSGVGVKN